MLRPNETKKVLDELCIKLGFCLSPEAQQQLIDDPPKTVRAFTDAVLLAEGLAPNIADRNLYRSMTDIVSQAFHRAQGRFL